MAKKFTRSPTNRFLGGVCGGIAEYTGAPAWLIRLIAVVLLFLPPIPFILVFLIYVILWAVIPLGTAKKPLDSNTIDAEFEVKE
ncbi:MAG TPA: PspC domain-containing protein [Methanocorpusculum sp.]|jgi:phage shock protein PspC (stress-responsive transcriptional regulator)|nr:PspC domain-containing protein [Methanocorpusculum sp.]HJJ80316.1 PspC domain-containing protein [Methanocorpusculum sp.]HJJ93211.1 PspC domain-containing protein [Methanocorpusculum sp.]